MPGRANTDLALEQLEAVTKIPGGPSYGELRLDPMWDPLRGDPRFEKIVASLSAERNWFPNNASFFSRVASASCAGSGFLRTSDQVLAQIICA